MINMTSGSRGSQKNEIFYKKICHFFQIHELFQTHKHYIINWEKIEFLTSLYIFCNLLKINGRGTGQRSLSTGDQRPRSERKQAGKGGVD